MQPSPTAPPMSDMHMTTMPTATHMDGNMDMANMQVRFSVSFPYLSNRDYQYAI